MRPDAKEELERVGTDVASQVTATLLDRFLHWIEQRLAARRARRQSKPCDGSKGS